MNTLPWYRSPVYVGIVTSIISQLLALAGRADLFPSEQINGFVEGLFQIVAVVMLLLSEWKRRTSTVQPLTLGKSPGPGVAPMLLVMLLPLALSVMLSACVTSNPYRYASTVLDRAHTTLRLLEEAQTAALPVLNSATVPEAVKASLRSSSRAATLAADQLGKAVVEVEAARKEVAGAQDGDARLRLANNRLAEWIQTVKERIAGIKAATKEVRTL